MNQPLFGASLSIKQCRNFKLDDQKVLKAALKELGLRRFRLMSYWDECEAEQGIYDFTILDAQMQLVGKHNGQVTLCLGVRQPRWPESHWPQWALNLPKIERDAAILAFTRAVVERYKDNPVLVSYQLENEALLKNFGLNGDFDRKRLRNQYKLVKSLDPDRPVIMTTSTSWGIPLRRPIPDIVGFSYYRFTYGKRGYSTTANRPWMFKLRASLIRLIWRRPSFIHELQAEPWGPKNIWEMDASEQDKSMSTSILQTNIADAESTNLYPIDLWGLEWWYWLKQANKPATWNEIKSIIK